MDIHAPYVDYFLTPVLPQFLQIFFLITINVYSFYIIHLLKQSYGYFTFGTIFIILNILYLNFFIFSHAGGHAGFASARGIGYFGFDYTLFFINLIQVIIVPMVFLLASTMPKFGFIEVTQRNSITTFTLISFLIIYTILYLVIVKPGIYYALLGDFESAKVQRINAVLGKTSEAGGVSKIFNYKNLVIWMLQAFIYGLILQSKNIFKSFLLIFIVLTLAFINFSKGSVVSSLLVLFVLYSYKNRKLSWKALIFSGFISIMFLIFYTYFFHETGISLESAINAILRRIYNNSSSAYLQINLYNELIPHYLFIQDWGLLSDLLKIEPEIPKELVYNEFYSGDGQGGSSFASDSYIAFGWGFVILIPFLLWPIIFMDYLLSLIKLKGTIGSNWLAGGILMFGIIFTNNIQGTPFLIINIFSFIRLEYLFFAFLFIVFLKIRFVKQ
jgi:hypothetical protein